MVKQIIGRDFILMVRAESEHMQTIRNVSRKINFEQNENCYFGIDGHKASFLSVLNLELGHSLK